jgi:hypothetical protein
MAATGSRAGRADATYRSLSIYWPERWRLLWHARNDRRAGLPVGVDVASTPVLRDLVTRHDDVCERERADCCSDIEPLDVRLAQLDTQIPALERDVEVYEQEARDAEAAITDRALSLRHAGEQGLAEELVRDRRRRELRRIADAAHARQTEFERRLTATREERAELWTKRQARIDIARSRALRFGDHTQRLAAIYRRALLRRHRQRAALVEQWQTDICPSPAWVVADDFLPSARPVGVVA